MSHSQLRTRMVADTFGGVLVIVLLAGIASVAPIWLVGAVVIGLIPAVLVIAVVIVWLSSRRRDPELSTVREAVNAHPAPWHSSHAAPTWDWPAHTAGPNNGAGRLPSDWPAPFSSTTDLGQA